jgi:oligopeptide/dipeptide ABC transporter ATP-binding protein
MYLGKIVEISSTLNIFNHAAHPYTKALLSAVPVPDIRNEHNRIILSGDVPSPSNPPSGCRFHTRCVYAMDVCKQIEPELRDIGENHFVACHLYSL